MRKIYFIDIIWYFVAALPVIALLIFAGLTGCQKKEDVEKYARIEKWESYQLTGACWFSCGKGDLYMTGFEAVKNGERFFGCVCSGVFKGATLRIE